MISGGVERGAGPGAWGRRGGEGARGQAGMNGRPPSAPRLCGSLLPPRPRFPHCLLRSCGALCRARGPTLKVSQFPEWGARPPRNVASAPSGAPASRRPRPPRPQTRASLVGSSGVGELRLLRGFLSSDRVLEQVPGTRGSSSPGRTRTVNTPGIARLWGTLLAPAPGGAAGARCGFETCGQRGSLWAPLCRVQVQPYS